MHSGLYICVELCICFQCLRVDHQNWKLYNFLKYRKNPKNSDIGKVGVIILKFEQYGFTI